MSKKNKSFLLAVLILLICVLSASCKSLSDIDLPEGTIDSSGIIWNDTGNGIVITGYNGTDPEVNIPSSFNGKPVTAIRDKAFKNNTAVTSVSIPESVVSIGTEAFSGCTALSKVNIPDGITKIAEHTFYKCESLTSITIPSSVISFDSGAFFSCKCLETVYYEGTLDTWLAIRFNDYSYRADANPCNNGAYFYIDGKLLTDPVIPDGTETIAEKTFCGCKSMTSITLPSSLKQIKNYAFCNCSSLINVYYAGTKEEWQEIYIDNKNTPLTKAGITYDCGAY